MTTMLEPELAGDPQRHPSVVWLVGAAALVVLAVGLVLTFGIHRPPALASLAEEAQPAPPGEVAWLAWDEDGRSCVQVATADGAQREVGCGRDLGELVGWTAEGLLLRTWDGGGEHVTVMDPTDGTVTARRASIDDDGPWLEQGLWSRWEDGALTVHDETDDGVLWRVDAPSSYRIEVSARSPGGDAIAATDTAGRLLLFNSEPGPPRIWLEGVDSWTPLVWSPDTRA
jgi:hypothetical protein